MKPLLIITCLIALGGWYNPVGAQCDPAEYKLILKLAQEDLENRNYQRSIERFLDARDVCPQNKEEVDTWIAEAFQRIEEEKSTAEQAQKDAKAAQSQAESREQGSGFTSPICGSQ